MSPPKTGSAEINMELVPETKIKLEVTDDKEEGKVSLDGNGKDEVVPPPEKKVKLEGTDSSDEGSRGATTVSLKGSGIKEEAGEDFKKPKDVDEGNVSFEETANKLTQTDYRTDILRIGSVSLEFFNISFGTHA